MENRSLEAKRAKLLETASQMLERSGYRQFKVAELAREASVSISTVYALFGSKEGLFLAYLETKIRELFDAIERVAEQDPILRLKHYASVVFGMAEKGKLIHEEGIRNNPLFFNTLSNEFPESSKKLYAFLAACLSEINPELDERQACRLGYGFNGQLHGYMRYWVTVGGSPQALSEELCNTYVCLARECYPHRRTGAWQHGEARI